MVVVVVRALANLFSAGFPGQVRVLFCVFYFGLLMPSCQLETVVELQGVVVTAVDVGVVLFHLERRKLQNRCGKPFLVNKRDTEGNPVWHDCDAGPALCLAKQVV